MEKSEQCAMCGTAEKEWLEDPDAYQARQVVCPGCAAKDRAREDSDTDRTVPGASIKLVTRQQAQRMDHARPSRPMSRRERARGGRR